MRYRCRHALKGDKFDWKSIEANSPEEAANDYHDQVKHGPSVGEDSPNGGKHSVAFSLVEVEGHGKFISRMYYYGIGRKGGVKPDQNKRLKEIAEAIGWEHDPKELLAPDWEFEETMEQARERDRAETERRMKA